MSRSTFYMHQDLFWKLGILLKEKLQTFQRSKADKSLFNVYKRLNEQSLKHALASLKTGDKEKVRKVKFDSRQFLN